jgi:hypothetical protein
VFFITQNYERRTTPVLANSSLAASLKGTVIIKGADAIEMNTVTGEITGSYVQEGENVISPSTASCRKFLLYVPR